MAVVLKGERDWGLDGWLSMDAGCDSSGRCMAGLAQSRGAPSETRDGEEDRTGKFKGIVPVR